MKGQPSRLPDDLAASVLSAAKGGDPQEAFSKDFGAGSVKGSTERPKPPQEGATATVTDSSTSSEQNQQDGKDWSRKTYRLRPDQYSTLAALEALMSSENGRRITASELARQAFDLLFERHQAMLMRLKPAPRTTEGT